MSIHATHLNVRPVRAFSDNYIWLIESPTLPAQVVAVDPGEAARGGMLVAIRDLRLHVERIDDLPAELLVRAVKLVANDGGRIYSFSAHTGEAKLAAGRVSAAQIGPSRASVCARMASW